MIIYDIMKPNVHFHHIKDNVINKKIFNRRHSDVQFGLCESYIVLLLSKNKRITRKNLSSLGLKIDKDVIAKMRSNKVRKVCTEFFNELSDIVPIPEWLHMNFKEEGLKTIEDFVNFMKDEKKKSSIISKRIKDIKNYKGNINGYCESFKRMEDMFLSDKNKNDLKNKLEKIYNESIDQLEQECNNILDNQ